MDSTGAWSCPTCRKACWSSAAATSAWRWAPSTPSWARKVSVVELTDGLLPGADRDLVKPLHKRLDKLFARHLSEHQSRSDWRIDRTASKSTFRRPTAKIGIEKFDRVLVSVGRRPNSNGFGLENTKVKIDERGFRDDRRPPAHGRSAYLGHRRRGRRADAGPQGLARRQGGRGSAAWRASRVSSRWPFRPSSSPIPKSPGPA